MFTGLVEAVGSVQRVSRAGGGIAFAIACPWPENDPVVGESVNVDGACFTVTGRAPGRFESWGAAETVRRTGLNAWKRGRRVNLERALGAASRLGGHFVQGHVDQRATLLARRREGKSWIHRYRTPDGTAPLLVPKGSVALDGVSLTISASGPGWFEVMLIPHTLAGTNLGDRRKGDGVNVETDILARYVVALLPPAAGAGVARRRRRARNSGHADRRS